MSSFKQKESHQSDDQNQDQSSDRPVTKPLSGEHWKQGLFIGTAMDALEPRVMLDAAGMDAANDALADAAATDAESAALGALESAEPVRMDDVLSKIPADSGAKGFDAMLLDKTTSTNTDSPVEFVYDAETHGNNPTSSDGIVQDHRSNNIELKPELVVDKLVDDVVPHLGQTITYTVVITNVHSLSGTGAIDVNVVDNLPAGMVFHPGTVTVDGQPLSSATGVTNNSVGNSMSLTFGEIGHGESVTVTYQATVSSDTADYAASLINTVQVDWQGADNSGAFDTDAVERVTLTAPDYDIAKSSSNTSPLSPGELFTYTIVLNNFGTHEGTNVVVTDNFPTTALGEPLSISNGGIFDPATGVITWNIGTLPDYEVVTLTVEAQVLDSLAADIDGNVDTSADSFTNTVTVTDDGLHGEDIDPSNNQAEDTDEVIAAPDYSVTKTNTIETAAPSDEFTYVIQADNHGTQAGTNVVIVDTYPTNILTVVDADGGVVDADAGTITWTYPVVNVGDQITQNVVMSVLPTATLDTPDRLFFNEVSITDDGTNGVDPTTENNTDSHSDKLMAGTSVTDTDKPVTLTAPDYNVIKSSSNTAPLNPGESFTYTIVVTNSGTHEGTNVVVTDNFPTTALGEPLSISNGGIFDPATGVITWNIGTLPDYEVVTLNVEAQVLDSLAADIDGNVDTSADSFTNTVTVTDDGLHGEDPDPSNNQAEDTDEVIAAPDYSVTKTNTIETAAPSDEFTYVIQADNHGTQAGTNVVIVDTYPTNILTVVDADGGVVDADAGTITWTYPVVNVGDQITQNVVMSVLPTATLDTPDQLFFNEVSITDDGTNGVDPTTEDNTDSHSDKLLASEDQPLQPITSLESEVRDNLWLDSIEARDMIPIESLIPSLISESRIISKDTMLEEQVSISSWQDDVARGGDLLDTYSLDRLPVSDECAIFYTRGDVSADDLLSSPDTGATIDSPWQWLEDLPDVEPSAVQAGNVVIQPVDGELSVIQVTNDIQPTLDNGTVLPQTPLNQATSLFKTTDTPISETFESLPERMNDEGVDSEVFMK